MEQGGGGGESAAKRARLSSGDVDSAAAAGEDRLSALHDDILVLILRRLTTRGAARTSVLSRRWRRVWALLPALHFRYYPDPRHIVRALEGHEAALLRLIVFTRDAAADSVSAWLPVAARRLSGSLVFNNDLVRERSAQEGGHEEAAQRGAFELPCLERATDVLLHLGFLGLAMPPAGVFARLTKLYLSSVRFHGPGLLDDAVSWPRCPCLQKLTIRHARGLESLAIHSDSLRQVELSHLRGLQQLNIVSPALEDLEVTRCFFYDQCQPIASITAPLLATLQWMDSYDPRSVHLGEMRHLRLLRPFFFMVYRDRDEYDTYTYNQSCLSLLWRFKVNECLVLTLTYLSDIDGYPYVMEDMTKLPDITILHLNIYAKKHAFGASAFHVLRMCSGIRKLILAFREVKGQTACPPGCICGEHENCETEHLLLNHLKEIEITHMSGSEHEVTFVKQLLIWGTALEKLTVFFAESATESVAKELSQVLRSFAGPKIRMEIHTYMDMRKMMHVPEL